LHNLFEAWPIFRRKFLDWGLFYQFDNFLQCWRHFERALKQRNALLRDRRPKRELDSWTEELIKYGLEMTQFRQKYVQLLVPYIAEAVQALLDIPDIQIHYHPGWDEDEDYAAILADYYQEEYRFGHTQFGPHRADLDINIDGIAVKHFLSRGQQKLLVCAMILAQGMLLAKQSNKGVIYLVDDLPAELDSLGRQKLISLLAKQKTQVFITAIEKETICDLIDQSDVPMKVFHVEHGCARW
jgi:DNA replication and repair protein RecF